MQKHRPSYRWVGGKESKVQKVAEATVEGKRSKRHRAIESSNFARRRPAEVRDKRSWRWPKAEGSAVPTSSIGAETRAHLAGQLAVSDLIVPKWAVQ